MPLPMLPTGRRQTRGARGETAMATSNECSPSHTSIALAYPVSHDLNFSNRPMPTLMPGGVAGVSQLYRLPLCRFVFLFKLLLQALPLTATERPDIYRFIWYYYLSLAERSRG